MKPRSSGEMWISSSGRSLPLKCAIGEVMAIAGGGGGCPSRAKAVGLRAHDDRHKPALAAARRGDETVAGRLRESGLEAVDGGIGPQQPVAIRLGDAVEGEFLLRIDPVEIGEIANQRGREG